MSSKLEFFVSFTSNIKSQRTYFFLLCVFICAFCENLIVLHDGDNNFIFFFNIYIKFTLSLNLNDEEMITSHLMCVIKQLYYVKNMFEREKKQQKNLDVTCYIKFRIL